MQNEADDAQRWLHQKDLWMERKKWIDANQPKYQERSSSVNLLSELMAGIEKHHLTVANKNHLSPKQESHYCQVTVGLTVMGSLEGIVRWLAELQQPKNFVTINAFTLDPVDESKMKCVLQISRLYTPSHSQT